MDNTTKKQQSLNRPVEKVLIAADFDGTITAGYIPPKDSVVITGRYKNREKETRRFLAGIQRSDMPIYFLPDSVAHTHENIGAFKAKTAKKLGVTKMYENEPEQIKVFKELAPEIELIQWKKNQDHDLGMTFVVFTSEGTGIPIAHHLQTEGYKVYLGQAESFKELGIESTPEEDKKLKDSQVLYEGILNRFPAKKLLKALSKVKDKDNYFILCDLNSLYKYGEILLKMGFTKGLFPTKDDYQFEKGREEAMEFVKKYYQAIKIIPFQKVKTVEEAQEIVENSEVPLVIQSEGDFVSTIVPPDDLEKNKTEILSALEKHGKEYSKGEIILKEKLVKPVEITPQIVFYDGEPVFTDIDIETKNIGDGENNGNQVGCGTNLIIKTELSDKINEIAFPPIVYEMAKKHKGIFVWDISIYLTEKGLFFGEFCSNRFGYDAVLTEMCMSGGAGDFFNDLVARKNPLKNVFGAAVRVFNLNKQKDTEITINDFKNTWVYEAKLKEDKWISLGVFWDLAVLTGSGDSIEDAVNNTYEVLKDFSFKEKYTRTKDDFLSLYPTSILQRFNETNHKYFDVPDHIPSEEVSEIHNKLKEMSDRIDKGIDGIETLKSVKQESDSIRSKVKDRIKSILHGRI